MFDKEKGSTQSCLGAQSFQPDNVELKRKRKESNVSGRVKINK